MVSPSVCKLRNKEHAQVAMCILANTVDRLFVSDLNTSVMVYRGN